MLKLFAIDQRPLLHILLADAFQFGHRIITDNRASIVEMVALVKPDLTIIAETLDKPGDGLTTAERLRAEGSNYNVVVLTNDNTNDYEWPSIKRREVLLAMGHSSPRAWAPLLHQLNQFLPKTKRVGEIWITGFGHPTYAPLVKQGHHATCFQNIEQIAKQLRANSLKPHLIIVPLKDDTVPDEAWPLMKLGCKVICVGFAATITQPTFAENEVVLWLPSSIPTEEAATAIMAEVTW